MNLYQRLAIMLGLIVAIVLSGCAVTAAPSTSTTQIPAPPEVVITATEYAFAGPSSVEAGFVTIRLENEGEKAHHAQLARVQDGMTREDVLGLFQTDPNAALAALTFTGGPGLVDPGRSQQVTLNLAPGSYLVLSFVPDENGVPYMAQGMVMPLDVTDTEENAHPAHIQSDDQVTLMDYSFTLPAEIAAGPQTWQVFNDGQQIHEMMLVQPLEGHSVNEVMAYLQNPQGPAPYANIGGFQGLTPGETGWLQLDLEPGEYVATCYIPTQEPGQTHVHMGMVQRFTVR